MEFTENLQLYVQYVRPHSMLFITRFYLPTVSLLLFIAIVILLTVVFINDRDSPF